MIEQIEKEIKICPVEAKQSDQKQIYTQWYIGLYGYLQNMVPSRKVLNWLEGQKYSKKE